jgi:hypothetical protein
MRIPEQTPADATAGLTKTSAKVQFRPTGNERTFCVHGPVSWPPAVAMLAPPSHGSPTGPQEARGCHTPYATWMKWHHYTGLVFGLFACTWAFSGALSLGPFEFWPNTRPSRASREAATGGPTDLTPLTVERIRAVFDTVQRSFTPKELDFFQFRASRTSSRMCHRRQPSPRPGGTRTSPRRRACTSIATT